MIFDLIFYYFYVLIGKTPYGKKNGSSVSITCVYVGIILMFQIFFIFNVLKYFLDVDLFSIIRLANPSDPYLIRKYTDLPIILAFYIVCYAYFKWRFPKIKQKFSVFTDKDILCWKNHVFVILVTLIPLAIIIYIASHY